MKKLFFCVLFLMYCIFLLAFSRREISFCIENKTDGEIIITTETYASSGDYEYSDISAYTTTNARLPQGRDYFFMSIIKTEELRAVPPLETFNDVFLSLKITDSLGTIILTEKDLTNASFSIVWDDDICILKVTNER